MSRRLFDRTGKDLGREVAGAAPITLADELAAQYVSRHTRFWIPGDQGAGNALDLSGNSADLAPAGTMTANELWASANKMSWPGGTGKYAQIASNQARINALDTSILFSFHITKAAGGKEWLVGPAFQNTWFLMWSDTHQLVIAMRGGDSEELFVVPSISNTFDGTEKHVVFAWDHATKTGWVFVNKVLKWSGAWALTKTTYNAAVNMVFGVVESPGAGATCYSMQLRALYLATPPSILSTPLQRIVRKLFATPGMPLQDLDFIA